jgi:ribonuclease VapC
MSHSKSYLLDASAMLALIQNEPGADLVLDVLDHSEIHGVNLAEVVRKLSVKGKPRDEMLALIEDLQIPVLEDFSVAQAYAVGELAAETLRLGFSLGDCVCLGMAEWLGMKAVTAERRWSELKGRSVEVMQIRP